MLERVPAGKESCGTRVAIILVNWNRAADTLECLGSLFESLPDRVDVIVVDNGSTADSLARLRSSQHPIMLIEAGTNLGFTGGNNLGIERALRAGAEFVVLLNNDTVVRPGWLAQLVDALECEPRAAISTPKILFYEDPNRVWFGGAQFSARWLSSRMTGYGTVDHTNQVRPSVTPFASGCAMCIRASLFAEIGVLDDRYFAVMEDVDFCLTARARGHLVLYVPGAVILHKESMSAGGQDAPQYVYYQVRNMVLLRRKWANGAAHFGASMVYLALYLAKRGARLAWRGQWRSLMGVWFGVVDGLRGVDGRRERVALSPVVPPSAASRESRE